MAGPGLPDPGKDARPLGRRRKLGRSDAAWSISNRTAQQQGHCQAGLATAATRQRQGDTPPSKARLGALLSSEDFGSRVGRDVGGHPVHSDEWPRLVMRQSLWRTSRFNTSQCWADMTRWKLIVESGEEKRVNVCDAADG